MRAGGGYGATSTLRMGMNSMDSPESDVEMHHGRADVAAGGIELDAGERRHEFHSRKSTGARFALAVFEQERADTAARVLRIDEKRANLRRLGAWIEHRGIAAGSRVAAEQGRPEAPAAASDESAVFLGHKIGLIGQQLRIDAECAAQRAFDLRGPVVFRAQAPRGAGDQRFELRDIGERGLAKDDRH